MTLGPSAVAGWVALVVALAAGTVGAQQPPPQAILAGVVFDSLAGAPLEGAQVSLGDGLATARTDAQGRFSLRTAPGEYSVAFSHPSLSGWGMLRHRFEVRLEAGRTVTATLATASAATVLLRTCGSSGAMVGGVVRDMLTLVPLAGAYVRVDTRAGEGPRGQTLYTAGDGAWYACLPDPGAEVDVMARMGELRSRAARVAATGPVRVQDLYIRVSEPAELVGLVTDGESGEPLSGADVSVLGTRLRTITADDGRFRFRGVLPGAIRLAVERLGYGRKVALVRAEGGSTARIGLELFPEAVAVDSVVVTVEGGVVDRDRLPTRFDGLTRSQVDALLHRVMSFEDLLRNANVPGLRVSEVMFTRPSGVRELGLCVELLRRSSVAERQCEMVEVYLNDVRLADPSSFLGTLSPASVDRIQVMSATNASIEYLGTPQSRNGILLIWTRVR